MEWETYKTNGIKDKYVFRYLTIEKLIDFFETNSIYLARLDKLEDNLENISPYYINQIKFREPYIEKPEKANPEISQTEWKNITENNREGLRVIQENLQTEQKKRFASCWFLSDVESFAMWDIYGKTGFALKFKRSSFQKIIKDSINLQEYPTNKLDRLVAGRVIYQNFNEMIFKEKEYKIKYSSFRKHLSFKHENEYRIVGFLDNGNEYHGLKFKIPSINKLEFEIIANPRLDSFQFEKYKSIIANYSGEKSLKESSLKSWLEFRNNKY